MSLEPPAPATTDESETNHASVHKPRKSLRVALGIVLILGMLAGWVAMGVQKAGRQADAVAKLRAAGASVYFDFQWKDGQFDPNAVPPEVPWVRRLLGDDFLNRVVAVDLRGTRDPDSLARLVLLLPYLTHINAADTPLTDASLSVWRQMPGLKSLDLQGTRVTAAGVLPLQRMPNLKQLQFARTAAADESETP